MASSFLICRSIPLFFVLLLQCLFVGGVFAALIVLMTTTTRDGTRTLVRERVLAQLGTAHEAIDGALGRYEAHQRMLRERVRLAPSRYECSEATLDPEAAGDFVRDGLSLVTSDPFVPFSYQIGLSKTHFRADGSPYSYECDACKYYAFTMFGGNSRITDGAVLKNLSLAANLSAVPFTDYPGLDYTDEQYVADALEFNDIAWKSAAYYFSVLNETATLLSCYAPLHVDPATNRTTAAIGLDVDMRRFASLLGGVTPPVGGAHTSVYDMRLRHLLATTHPTPIFRPDQTLFVAGASDSAELNTAFSVGRALGTRLRGGEGAVDDDVGGRVVSALRLTTPSGLNLLFVQSTPRAHYYAALESTERAAIGISAGAAVLVLLACAGVLLAIRTPLVRMQTQMELAAVMRNDEVDASGRSVLTDVAALQAAFAAMNAKLLFARSFMPQSVLCSSDEMADTDFEGAGDVSAERQDLPSSDEGTCRSSRDDARRCSNIPCATASMSLKEDHASSSDGLVGRALEVLALTPRRVGVLAINVRGFHAVVENGVPAAMADPAAMLVAAVQAAVGKERGVVDSYHGDHFVLTFNAARPVPQVGARLCGCAMAVREALSTSCFARLSMGAAAGRAVVGHLGTDTLRRFSVVGAAYRRAVRLETTCADLSDNHGPTGLRLCDALVDAAAALDAETAFVLLAISPATHTVPQLVSLLAGRRAAAAADEWLYEVATHASSAAAHYNAIFAAVCGGDVPAANVEAPASNDAKSAVVDAVWARLRTAVTTARTSGRTPADILSL